MTAERRLATRVVRSARVLPGGAGAPVVPAAVQGGPFDYWPAAEQDAVFGNGRPGYVYGRYGTPTTAALEEALADLDGTEAAVCFVSGMSAIHALVTACTLAQRRAIVAQEDCYGQVRALLERLAREEGAAVRFVDATDHAAVERAVADTNAALLHVEAIANPLLRVADVRRLAEIAHAHGTSLAVDASFATPLLLRPATLGADVVVHSLTKYVNGHGDAMGGAVAGSRALAAAM